MINLSIIVPVYNVVGYLRDCTRSLVESYEACDKSATTVEVILADDGSDDGSGELCDQLAQEHPLFRALHRPHAGVAAVRNAALGMAVGEYVGWVDADDWVDSSFLQAVSDGLSMLPDILFFDLKNDQGRGMAYGAPAGRVSKATFMHDLMRDGRQRSFLCNKVFARRLFEDARFDETLSQLSDFAILPRVASQAETIAYLPSCLYVYRMRTGSITNQFAVDRLRNRFHIVLERLHSAPAEFQRDALSCALYQAFWICRQLLRAVNDGDAAARHALITDCVHFVRAHFLSSLLDPGDDLRRKFQLIACASGALGTAGRLYDFMLGMKR